MRQAADLIELRDHRRLVEDAVIHAPVEESAEERQLLENSRSRHGAETRSRAPVVCQELLSDGRNDSTTSYLPGSNFAIVAVRRRNPESLTEEGTAPRMGSRTGDASRRAGPSRSAHGMWLRVPGRASASPRAAGCGGCGGGPGYLSDPRVKAGVTFGHPAGTGRQVWADELAMTRPIAALTHLRGLHDALVTRGWDK